MNVRRLLPLPAAIVLTALALTACQSDARTPAASETASEAAASASAAAHDVKSIHSPGIVAIDERLSDGQCSVKAVNASLGEYLPDPICTPGAVDPAVTQGDIDSTICTSGYAATVRPPASVTGKVKSDSLREYAQSASNTTELDHLISLELGGTNSVSNLWPEQNKAGATGTTNPKDEVENILHKAVCSHWTTLAAAQEAIASNWVTAVKDLGL
ncbi:MULTISPECIES: hypothetical protein [Arthrobacter]|uniref:HNH endonuclease n=2 Tax=Arthrobacter TaxID=1663 RepID=A0ABU9KGB3_9MICC|nr:hypothetical protein [Arthrobacter sp. YJM1]MDP5225922.1 hypothetical protein [Arthrobacter sp. YJM1]